MGGEKFYVHRVVAWTFLGNPPIEDAWQVHHKDGNPGNNHVTNLEYVTQSQNINQSYASGTRCCGGPMRSKPVMYRPVGYIDWTTCPSITLAALKLGVSQGAVSRACRHQTGLKGYEVSAVDLQEQSLPGEEWKPMLCPLSRQEVDGRLVSSLGRLRLRSGLVHKGHLRKSGYSETKYSCIVGSRTELVHRVVAFAFFGPPPSPERSQVNHKDGDKQNNAVVNLEYATPAENRAHYLKFRTTQHERKLRSDSKPIWSRVYNSNEEWTWHPSILSAAQVRGLRSGLVSHSIHGKQRQTGGHEFRVAHVFEPLPGEEWREVDVAALVEEKRKRLQAHLTQPV